MMTPNSPVSTLDKANSAVHSAIDEAAHKAHQASDKAASVGNLATDWVSRRSEEFTATPKRLIDDASVYVSANPLKSLGIAVVAALVVGRLIR